MLGGKERKKEGHLSFDGEIIRLSVCYDIGWRLARWGLSLTGSLGPEGLVNLLSKISAL